MKQLMDQIIQFRKERDWEKFHNPKDLAISISLEASELLENFQWKNSEESIQKNFLNIKEELADILIYTLYLSHDLKIDVNEAILEKLEKNKQKYPVEKAYGLNKKYNEL